MDWSHVAEEVIIGITLGLGGGLVTIITIGTQGTEKIDGADTYVINTAKGKVELASDGSNLFVVG